MIATIILLVLLAVDLGISLAKDGEPKEGKYSFWVTLIAIALYVWLYYEAGLFNNFKWQ